MTTVTRERGNTDALLLLVRFGMTNPWHLTERLHVDLRLQASCVCQD